MENNWILWYMLSKRINVPYLYLLFEQIHSNLKNYRYLFCSEEFFCLIFSSIFKRDNIYIVFLRLGIYVIFVYTDNNFFIYRFAYPAVYIVYTVHCLISERKNNNKAKLSFYLKLIRPYNSQYLQFTSSIFIRSLSTLRGRNNDMLQALTRLLTSIFHRISLMLDPCELFTWKMHLLLY